MTKLTINKDQIREKLGGKNWLDSQIIIAKLDYESGITVFDEILDGKSLKEFDAVIHLEKYPKGLLFKIVKGLGFKTYPYPLAKNEIKKVILKETFDSGGQLTFDLTDGNKIEFRINKYDLWEIKSFLEEIKLNYEMDKIKKPITQTEKETQNGPNNIKTNNNRYPALRAIASIYIILAWIIGITVTITIFYFLFENKIHFLEFISLLIVGGLLALGSAAVSETIKVFIDIEYNTRKESEK